MNQACCLGPDSTSSTGRGFEVSATIVIGPLRDSKVLVFGHNPNDTAVSSSNARGAREELLFSGRCASPAKVHQGFGFTLTKVNTKTKSFDDLKDQCG